MGAEAVAELWRLPAAAGMGMLLTERDDDDEEQDEKEEEEEEEAEEDGKRREWAGTVDCFLRRYTADTRPFIPFHCDGAAATVNVALTASEDDTAMGGELLCLHSGKVVTERRQEGEATVHPAGLLHGVTRLENGAGERFSMILFFEPPPPRDN